MSTTTREPRLGRFRWRGPSRRSVGVFFVWTSGIHVGIVAADTELYRSFAGGAVVPFVRSAWRDVFMAHPAAWGLALAVGELAIGLLLLRGGIEARIGWVGVIAFQLCLVLFGWGFLLWVVPALLLVLPAARGDLRR